MREPTGDIHHVGTLATGLLLRGLAHWFEPLKTPPARGAPQQCTGTVRRPADAAPNHHVGGIPVPVLAPQRPQQKGPKGAHAASPKVS